MISSCFISSENIIYSDMNSPYLDIVSAGHAYTFAALEFATCPWCAACCSFYTITHCTCLYGFSFVLLSSSLLPFVLLGYSRSIYVICIL